MDETRTPAEEDAAFEAAVLQRLLDLYPGQITVEELVRELAGGEGDFSQRDAIERAVQDLCAVDLLRRSGELVFPSRAAVRFDELLG